MEPLATVGELSTHLENPELAEDRATLALSLASGAVRAYCGWDLSLDAVTFEVEGDGSQVLSLPTLNLISLDELRINGEVVAATDRRWPMWSRKGQLYAAAGWPLRSRIEAYCVHGYEIIPDLIKLVVLDLASRQLANPEGLVSKSVGSVSRTYATNRASGDQATIVGLHARLLDRYAL